MNLDIIIRNFKLRKLFDVKLDEPYLSLYNDLESMFGKLNIYKSEGTWRHFTIYGRSKNKICMWITKSESTIWISEYMVWDVLKEKYNFSDKDEDIEKILGWYLKNNMGLNGTVHKTKGISEEYWFKEGMDNLEKVE